MQIKKTHEHKHCYFALAFFPRALTRAHRAFTAFLALSLRSSAVMLAALAGPPFRPPLRPNATAYGFFFCGFGIRGVYVTAQEKHKHYCVDDT